MGPAALSLDSKWALQGQGQAAGRMKTSDAYSVLITGKLLSKFEILLYASQEVISLEHHKDKKRKWWNSVEWKMKENFLNHTNRHCDYKYVNTSVLAECERVKTPSHKWPKTG